MRKPTKYVWHLPRPIKLRDEVPWGELWNVAVPLPGTQVMKIPLLQNASWMVLGFQTLCWWLADRQWPLADEHVTKTRPRFLVRWGRQVQVFQRPQLERSVVTRCASHRDHRDHRDRGRLTTPGWSHGTEASGEWSADCVLCALPGSSDRQRAFTPLEEVSFLFCASRDQNL